MRASTLWTRPVTLPNEHWTTAIPPRDSDKTVCSHYRSLTVCSHDRSLVDKAPFCCIAFLLISLFDKG